MTPNVKVIAKTVSYKQTSMINRHQVSKFKLDFININYHPTDVT